MFFPEGMYDVSSGLVPHSFQGGSIMSLPVIFYQVLSGGMMLLPVCFHVLSWGYVWCHFHSHSIQGWGYNATFCTVLGSFQGWAYDATYCLVPGSFWGYDVTSSLFQCSFLEVCMMSLRVWSQILSRGGVIMSFVWSHVLSWVSGSLGEVWYYPCGQNEKHTCEHITLHSFAGGKNSDLTRDWTEIAA